MNLGLVFKSGDAVLIGVFLSLVLMSIITWTLVIIRTIKYLGAKKANGVASEAIWSAHNLAQVVQIAKQNPSPISEVTLCGIDANRRFVEERDTLMSANLPRNDYLERELHHCMNKISSRFEGGMVALATIGSTAPFIGLLGTVWGIYHALINIGQSGQMSIAAVAGPIGEALVATAIGLFVAIPAVLAYNIFSRVNKNMNRQMHNFVHEFHVQLINSRDGE